MMAAVPSIDTRGGNWNLGINPAVPVDLTVHTGVGQSRIDLSQLNLTRLEMNMGVGEVRVTLPDHGQFQANVHSGVGQATVEIPRNIAARIRVHAGLGSVSVSGDYTHQGDYYLSPGYDSATDRIDLELSGGIGQVVIRQVAP